jgi:hypothetical protein
MCGGASKYRVALCERSGVEEREREGRPSAALFERAGVRASLFFFPPSPSPLSATHTHTPNDLWGAPHSCQSSYYHNARALYRVV